MLRIYLISFLLLFSSTTFAQHSEIDFTGYLFDYIQQSKELSTKDSTAIYLVEVEASQTKNRKCLKFYYYQNSVLKMHRDTLLFSNSQTSEIERTFIFKNGISSFLPVLIQKLQNISNPDSQKVFDARIINSLLGLVNRVSLYRKRTHFFLDPIIVFEEEPVY
jgi:hypothetical protein